MRQKVASELARIAELLSGAGRTAANYRSWERKVLKTFKDDYGLDKNDIDKDQLQKAFSTGDRPDEFVDWFADKYDIDSMSSLDYGYGQ